MNSPQVTFKVTDLTERVPSLTQGITFIMGTARRGPINSPEQVFTSWPAFVRVHGGLTNDLSTLMVKRILDKGGLVRFCRLAHYTTINNSSTLTATKATVDVIEDGDENELFELVAKYEGSDMNLVSIVIGAASNGRADHFNLSIEHSSEPNLNELYTNIRIPGRPTVSDSNYLRRVVESSALVDVVYKDLSGIAGSATLTPVAGTTEFSGGINGSAITDTDIIGDSDSNTGFHSFDEYDDAYLITLAMNNVSDAVHVAGSAYTANRKDLIYLMHLSHGLNTTTALINKRDSLLIDNKFCMIVQGGLIVTNPQNGQKVNLDATTDVAALAANSDTNFGPWYSFSGNNRGIVTNALGVVNNYGTAGKAADLDIFANRQINSLINRDRALKLWGGFTAQVRESQESFVNIVKLVIFIKRSLRPLLENYLEEPNDMSTWKLMYYQVKPFFDDLISQRALYNYEWQGDQFATDLNSLVTNNASDVSDGKYKVKLILYAIPAIQGIEVELVLTKGNMSIEEVNNL